MPALSSFERTESPWRPNLSRRLQAPEIIDQEVLSEEEALQTFKFLRFTNRHFGGTAVILKNLERFCSGWDRKKTLRIVDIGTGLGDIPVAVASWARRRGLRIQLMGVERSPQAARLARNYTQGISEVRIEEGDIFSSRFAESGCDIVTGSLLLHHLEDEEINILLKQSNEISNLGVIFSDLYRSLPGYWAVKTLSLWIGNEVVQHDGPLSVRRSFRLEELDRAAGEAGCPYLKARREPFFRLSLAGMKSHG